MENIALILIICALIAVVPNLWTLYNRVERLEELLEKKTSTQL